MMRFLLTPSLLLFSTGPLHPPMEASDTLEMDASDPAEAAVESDSGEQPGPIA